MIFSFSIDVRNRGRSSHKSSKRTFYLHHLPSLNFDFKVIDVNSIKFQRHNLHLLNFRIKEFIFH